MTWTVALSIYLSFLVVNILAVLAAIKPFLTYKHCRSVVFGNEYRITFYEYLKSTDSPIFTKVTLIISILVHSLVAFIGMTKLFYYLIT